MSTLTEENYLKAIYKLSGDKSSDYVKTTSISKEMATSASSVTDMLQRLAEKNYLNYKRYKGASLTRTGSQLASRIVRKHRLWEVFLVEKLGFPWDEVHDIAEQLEHINSPVLTQKLEAYLGYPKFDPHGDPIPDEGGNVFERAEATLAQLEIGDSGELVGVKDSSSDFLHFMDGIKLSLGARVKLIEHISFDDTLVILVNGKRKLTISSKASRNIYLKRI